MRIAHVSDCYLPRLGGIERQVNSLAVHQHEAGHHVEVITSSDASGPDPEDPPLRVHRLDVRGDEGTIHYAASLRGRSLVTERRFDVVHAHLSTWSPLAFFAVRAAIRAGVPAAVTVHSMWAGATPLVSASARALRWRHWPVAWSAVSAAAARSVVDVLGDGVVSVVPNGVVAGQWSRPARVPDCSRVVIASVMRLVARKRPRQLLRILARLRREVPIDIRIDALIIGDGALRQRLEADLVRLGISDWVRLAGRLSSADIAAHFGDCDIYVAPATLESFGIAALEARAAGLPIVAHARTGVEEFVRDGVHGLLVDDDGAMVAALRELVMKPALRVALAENSRAQPPAIDWHTVLGSCEVLYDRAAALCQPTSLRRGLAEVPV